MYMGTWKSITPNYVDCEIQGFVASNDPYTYDIPNKRTYLQRCRSSWLSHRLVENWTGASHIQPRLLRILAGADRFETGWTQKHVIWAEQQKIHRCLQASRLAAALMSVCSRNIRSSCCLGALQFDNVSSLPATSCGSDRRRAWALCSDSWAGASSKSLPWLVWRKRD